METSGTGFRAMHGLILLYSREHSPTRLCMHPGDQEGPFAQGATETQAASSQVLSASQEVASVSNTIKSTAETFFANVRRVMTQ